MVVPKHSVRTQKPAKTEQILAKHSGRALKLITPSASSHSFGVEANTGMPGGGASLRIQQEIRASLSRRHLGGIERLGVAVGKKTKRFATVAGIGHRLSSP